MNSSSEKAKAVGGYSTVIIRVLDEKTINKIAEGEVGSSDYEVAVCVKYSPEQQSEAADIKNLGASKEIINSI
mgnify:CR=1 FL=1